MNCLCNYFLQNYILQNGSVLYLEFFRSDNIKSDGIGNIEEFAYIIKTELINGFNTYDIRRIEFV